MYASSQVAGPTGPNEILFDHLPRPTDAPAMRLEILSSDLPANATSLEVIEGFEDRLHQSAGIVDALTCPTHLENAYDLPGIFEVRSEQDWTSGMDGLDEIVSANGNECPAYEGDRRCRIHRGQLSKRIQNEYLSRNEVATLETTA